MSLELMKEKRAAKRFNSPIKCLFIVEEFMLHLYNLRELDYIQTTKSRLTNKLSFNMNQSVFSLAALISGMSVFIWVRPSEHSITTLNQITSLAGSVKMFMRDNTTLEVTSLEF